MTMEKVREEVMFLQGGVRTKGRPRLIATLARNTLGSAKTLRKYQIT